MRTFTFILSSGDYRTLDRSISTLFTELTQPGTEIELSILPAERNATERVQRRKAKITSDDLHIVQKLQRIDLQQVVQVEGFTE
jgi:hypothetical protein